MTEQKNLDSIRKMLDTPDFSIIKNVYFKISLKAFIECFTNITRMNRYYNAVFETLFDIAKRKFNTIPEDRIRENLSVAAMIKTAENILMRNDECGFSDSVAFFIIEKLIAEPLAILGKELHKEKEDISQFGELPF